MTRSPHADAAVPGGTSLSGRRVSLHADIARPAGIAALALHALSPGELDGSAEIVRAVLPAPGADGVIGTRDGRRGVRVPDPAALAARLNAQDVGVRIDFDHQTEPSSPTFRGSTAAEGWARSFRAAADGSVEAVLGLSGWARHAIGSRQYRYLSPALWFDEDTGEVEGMSHPPESSSGIRSNRARRSGPSERLPPCRLPHLRRPSSIRRAGRSRRGRIVVQESLDVLVRAPGLTKRSARAFRWASLASEPNVVRARRPCDRDTCALGRLVHVPHRAELSAEPLPSNHPAAPARE